MLAGFVRIVLADFRLIFAPIFALSIRSLNLFLIIKNHLNKLVILDYLEVFYFFVAVFLT